MKLFLDDLRSPPDVTWTVVRTYDDAVQLVTDIGFPEEVSFDHDLGLACWPKTGLDFAHFLVDLDLDTGAMPDNFSYHVHSANPTGAENIRGLMDGYLRHRNGNRERTETC